MSGNPCVSARRCPPPRRGGRECGPRGLAEPFTSAFAAHPDPRIGVKRIIADGDLVAFHHHFQLSAEDLGAAVMDIFPVRNGKVVEHGDVVQPVPAAPAGPAASADDNTMFQPRFRRVHRARQESVG
ncbi:nuclear transport factor 2 family protein [Streptomyces monashensis]|uniref:nuclear transport factor 2 family protein n=1 Tax=Streptomyces monashensis TaxID=1678012 RepID=UPI0024820908|nr:nuclear transport factor 2 family protein [Streptomyces monashensis]